MKKLLTNYIFKFLFHKNNNYKSGDLLVSDDYLFIFDDCYGNPNSLRISTSKDGFWNYLKAKKDSVYYKKNRRFKEGEREFSKNNIRRANKKEIQFYKNISEVLKK